MTGLIAILILVWSIGGVIVGVLWTEEGLLSGISRTKYVVAVFICGPITWVVMVFRALYNVVGDWLREG